ncbi:hypothetical protein Rhein_1794 [Rheinheimera sp. A13L]|uniref:hypothetical protein n=1 Tax=Rheinheimera sp. A13L TaxID=506534 RepID=UPI0002124D60|nr:hypothetical protein [Rheinheimera sp. A13L]EGM78373.1 hypothetical protein Rhein_1794 [Rheinheimera sp. A13L]
MTNKKWPNDYPSGMVLPPDSAEEINAQLYRFVGKVNPDAADFLASYKDPKQKNLANRPAIKKKPSFYATSFFDTEDSIQTKLAESPERFSDQFIACGNVTPEHGKGESSEHSHHVSVWFYDGVYPEGFKVV